MAINLSIKKYLLLAAGLLFCGAAKAAETATYTWDFSSAAAVMGGTATGNFNTAQDAEKGTVLTGSTFDERGTNVFREMLNGALSGEGTMSITMDISWGGNNSLENIIHVARSEFGFSLGLSNGAVAINSGNLSPGGAIAEAGLTANTWTNIMVLPPAPQPFLSAISTGTPEPRTEEIPKTRCTALDIVLPVGIMTA